ncbi:hypothetical protein EJB05_21330, partial [Eragrostis curvula]
KQRRPALLHPTPPSHKIRSSSGESQKKIQQRRSQDAVPSSGSVSCGQRGQNPPPHPPTSTEGNHKRMMFS